MTTQANNEALEELVGPAAEMLKKLFSEKDIENIEEKQLAIARLGASLLSTWARVRQTDNARMSLYYNMAHDLAQNPEQLREYIRVTMPDAPLAKALPAPTTKS